MTALPDFSFSKSSRLLHKKDFEFLREQSKRCSFFPLVAYFRPSRLHGKTRLGLSVGRKVGNSVKRNIVKRQLREAFRHKSEVRSLGLDLMLVCVAPIENKVQLNSAFELVARELLKRKV